MRYSYYQGVSREKSKLAISIAAMASAAVLLFTVLVQSAAAVSLITVRPDDVRPVAEAVSGDPGWYRETRGAGTVELNDTVVYNNAGSAEFKTTASFDYAELALYNELGSLKLGELTSMSYATYQPTDDVQAVALQVGVDFDVTDTDTSWQGRLVYEPYQNKDFFGNDVTGETWQTWLTLDDDAQWWMTWSASATAAYGVNPCPQSNPCSFSEILALFPDAGFNAGFGNPLALKAGSGWGARTVYADGVNVNDSIWDFEPALATPTQPTTKEECMDGGWMSFQANYKNQGQCVASVQSSENSKLNRQ